MRFMSIFLLGSLLLITACSETRYAAHLAKQVTLPSDTPETRGYFKVGSSYRIKGERYYPSESYTHKETGIASWYGPNFHGKLTANGEIFDQNELTAAHRTLQMPSLVRVTNLENGKALILRVNDRGPFAHDRVIDVSKRAAELLDFKHKGTTKVRIEVLAEESRQIAAAAKSGKDTRGYEVALNQNRMPEWFTPASQPEQTQLAYSSPPQKPSAMQPRQTNPSIQQASFGPVPSMKPQPVIDDMQYLDVQQASLPQQNLPSSKIEAEMLEPNFEGAIQNRVIQPPTQKPLSTGIYVQAGAFSQENNAIKLANSLQAYAPSTVSQASVNDQPFYRVRLGPFASSDKAQETVSTLHAIGKSEAKIITE